MRRRSRFSSILRLSIIAIVALGGGFLSVFLYQNLAKKNDSQALSATEFQPGRIIDDSIFYNPNTMTAAEIDAFIDSHSPACDMWGNGYSFGGVQNKEYARRMREAGNSRWHEPPYVCISEFYENPETHVTNFETNGVKQPGMLSAGEIIYKAAQTYNVNPQVLLVMLKKESYAWGDDWPLKWEYNTVMGYACPDGAPCNEEYFGFYNQMMTAAWQLNYYREHIYSYNYRPYATNNILYNPDRSCGSKPVYLENIATTSLYIYTPYVPNDDALRNYPGTSWCGSYGNRNFYMYFREWFGGTLSVTRSEAFFPDGEYYIVLNSDPTKSLQLENGKDGAGTKIALGNRTDSARNKFTIKKQSDGSYSFVNSQSGQAMDITGASFTAGTSIEQWTSHGGDAQKFVINDNADGSYTIVPKRNKGFAIGYNSSDNMFYLDANIESEYQKVRLIPTTQAIEDGTYRITSGKSLQYELDINYNDSKIDGTNISLWSSHLNSNQSFRTEYNSTTGYYRIIAAGNPEYSLDVTGGSKDPGANIQLWKNNSSCAQQWSALKQKDDSIHLVSACSGLAMDISAGKLENGSNIILWTNHNGANQQFRFIPVTQSDTINTDGYYTLFRNDSSDSFLSALDKTAKVSNNKNDSIIKLEALSNGYYRLQMRSSGKYLTENSSSSAISFEEADNRCEQSWAFIKGSNDTYRLANACTTDYLVAANTIAASKEMGTDWTLNSITPKGGVLPDGEYRIVSVLNSNSSLDITGFFSANGTNIEIWSSNNTKAQFFDLEYDESVDAYKITDTYTNRALDVSGGTPRDGDNVIMWSSNDHCNQRWRLKEASGGANRYSLIETCNGLALDIFGANSQNGANVGVWRYHGDPNQQWTFVKL